MPGRSCIRLLVIFVMILSAALVGGQVGRRGGSREGEIAPAAERIVEGRAPPSAEYSDGLRPPRTGASGTPLAGAPVPKGPLTSGTPAKPAGFQMIANSAGTIFSGTVTRVARRPATRGQSVETVAITFHIENAIRGTTLGEDLTILQWMGLWSAGQRYRVGERVLLFLYPPSKLGLTSCVGGPMGRFSIDPLGRVLLTAQHFSSFKADPILGGKSLANFNDFARAVERAGKGD